MIVTRVHGSSPLPLFAAAARGPWVHGSPREPLEAVLPGLGRWLEKVFWVMGGYMAATGVLTIYVALSSVRDGSSTAWVVASAAGVLSVGLMAAVNLTLRSDFRWPLLGLASLWTAAALLAAFGV